MKKLAKSLKQKKGVKITPHRKTNRKRNFWEPATKPQGKQQKKARPQNELLVFKNVKTSKSVFQNICVYVDGFFSLATNKICHKCNQII